MEFTVDRSLWARGKKFDQYGDSRLLNEFGCMCCLGFLAKACGYEDEQLDGTADPEELFKQEHEDLWPDGLLRESSDDDLEFRSGYDRWNTDACHDIINTNDDETIGDELREEMLTILFARLGIKIVFVNE